MNNTANAKNTVDTKAEVVNVPVDILLPAACREPLRSNQKELFYLVYATDLFGIPEMDPNMIVPVFKKETPYLV